MKALLISDIHANIYALEAIWEHEKDSDLIYCAGDLVDYGPNPKEVIDWMREHNVVCVKGNHDQKVAAYYRDIADLDAIPDEERKWAHDNAKKLGESEISYLESLPLAVSFELDSFAYCMQHKFYKYESIQSLVEFHRFWEQQSDESIKGSHVKRMIFGHTHRRAVHYLSDDELWINPGSISYRRQDDPTKGAHYMTITDGQIDMKHLNYDRSALLQASLATRMKSSEREAAFIYFG